jgi:hypothetical protein
VRFVIVVTDRRVVRKRLVESKISQAMRGRVGGRSGGQMKRRSGEETEGLVLIESKEL